LNLHSKAKDIEFSWNAPSIVCNIKVRCYLESCSCSSPRLPRQEATPGRFKVSSVLSRHPRTFPRAQPAQIHRQEEGLAVNLGSTVITLSTGGCDPPERRPAGGVSDIFSAKRHLLCGSLHGPLELDTKPRIDNTLHTALSQARRESLHRWEPWGDALEE
jgi:hypothetical protein